MIKVGIKSISTLGLGGDANGQRRPVWPATGSTGNPATPTGRPVPANLLPLPLPCRGHFCTPTGEYIWQSLYIAEFRVEGLGAANKMPAGSGDSVCREGSECLRWGGCQDPPKLTEFSTGSAPVGANRWRCPNKGLRPLY